MPRRPKIGSPRPRVAVKVWLPLAAMLFVATALFLIRPESGSAPSEDGTPVLRGGGVTAEAGTSPESGAVIPLAETPLLFRWPAASEGGRYRLVILDDVGQRVFHAETTELGQDVESAALGVGDFYWTLERIYPDGTTATERTRSFQIVGAQSVEGVPK